MYKIFASMKNSVTGPKYGIKKLNSLSISSWIFSLLVAAVMTLGLSIPASHAATYYVSTTGNDSYAGTSLKPFRTIQKAANLTRAGDTVIVKNGTYTSTSTRVLNISRPGTSSAYITYKAENKRGAIIDGRNYATDYGIVLTDKAAYIKIDGFEVRNFRNSGIHGFGSTVTGGGSHHINITNNHIYNIGRYTISSCSDAYGRCGIYTHQLTKNYLFDGNTIHDVGRLPNSCQEHAYKHDHGMYLQGKYQKVTNNIFYNFKAGWAIKVDGYWGSEVGASENTHVIANNKFQPAVRTDPAGGGQIRFCNNQTYNSKFGVMKPPKNVLIDGNSFYKPDGVGTKSAIVITNVSYSNFKGTVVRNNRTSSKYLYCEYLGSAITKNVTAVNNTLNAYDSLFTSAERVNPNS